jgi:hypothetical protein
VTPPKSMLSKSDFSPKSSRHGSEMGIFTKQLDNPGFKVVCGFGNVKL